MREHIRECERAAHAGGLAAGLAVALTGVDADAPPGAVTAVPSSWVTGRERVIPHSAGDEEGVSFLRCGPRDPAPARGLVAVAARLGAARLGVTRRLTEHVIEHLSGRLSGGEPILRKQLVQGTLADVLLETEAVRAGLLTSAGTAVAVTDAHDRLTAMDWELAKLLGASGYAGGHTRGVHVSRLTANCWVRREADRG